MSNPYCTYCSPAFLCFVSLFFLGYKTLDFLHKEDVKELKNIIDEYQQNENKLVKDLNALMKYKESFENLTFSTGIKLEDLLNKLNTVK